MQALEEARERTHLIASLFTDDELQTACCDFLSPPVWDLGHIANFEERWLLQHLQQTTELRGGYNQIYNAFENPRHTRPKLNLLNRETATSYMEEVRARVRDGARDPFLDAMLANHEAQHQETLLQSMQFRGPRPVPATPLPEGNGPGDWVHIPASTFSMGRAQTSGVYDNEAPAHNVALAPFEIMSTPVTIGEFQEFVDAGGYETETAWSERGWRWVQEEKAKRPRYWTETTRHALTGERPLAEVQNEILCHVTHFEAEAFAKWKGARLPTEQEWERAAAGATAGNVDQLGFQPGTAGSGAANDAGLYNVLGDVWEWTSSDFTPYPGFQAHPYKEYSEVFFGGDYKVLRGGSWATTTELANVHFRNWDHPYRSQIFSGFRLAR